MNTVIISGNMCADPTIRMSSSGLAILKFTVGVYAGKDKDTNFIQCVAFGVSANMINDRASKGSKVYIEGMWQSGSYEKDGVKKYTNECMVNRVEFEKSAYAKAPADTNYTPGAVDDLKESFDGSEVPF